MSGRKSFILKFNYLSHPREILQNTDNKINAWRLKKLIFTWCFPTLGEAMFSTVDSLQLSGKPPRGSTGGGAGGCSSSSGFHLPHVSSLVLGELYTSNH